MDRELTVEIDVAKLNELFEKDKALRQQIAAAIINSAPPETRKNIIWLLIGISAVFTNEKNKVVKSEKIKTSIRALESTFGGRYLNILMESLGIIQKNDEFILEIPIEMIVERLNYFYEFYNSKNEIDKSRSEVNDSANAYITMPLSLYENIENTQVRDGDLIMQGTVRKSPDGSFAFYSVDGVEWHNDALFKRFPPGTKVNILKKGRGAEVKKIN